MTTALSIRRWKPLAWMLAVLVLVAAGTWLAGLWGPSMLTGSSGTVTRTAKGEPGLGIKPGVDLFPLDQRQPAPQLEGVTLDGEKLTLAGFRGKIVVVNVWGSWCGPCRAETPDLVRLANQENDRQVSFFGIDTRDNTPAAKAFVRNFQVPYPSIEDPHGAVLLAFQGVLPTSVVPSTVVIDSQGRIAARVIGPVTYTTLKGILDDELDASGGR